MCNGCCPPHHYHTTTLAEAARTRGTLQWVCSGRRAPRPYLGHTSANAPLLPRPRGAVPAMAALGCEWAAGALSARALRLSLNYSTLRRAASFLPPWAPLLFWHGRCAGGELEVLQKGDGARHAINPPCVPVVEVKLEKNRARCLHRLAFQLRFNF